MFIEVNIFVHVHIFIWVSWSDNGRSTAPRSESNGTMFFPPSSLVLGNRDLLDIIFGFFFSYQQQELLAASLTCKAFLEPALDALWNEVEDIMPLCSNLCSLVPSFDKDTYVRKVVNINFL